MRIGMAVLAAALAAAMVGSGSLAGAQDLGAMRDEALGLVNAAREAEGLGALSAEAALDAAAQMHAEDMAARGYFDHFSPEGASVRDRVTGGYSRLVAENIATCGGCPAPPDVARVRSFHAGWMGSPEHRANILREGVTRFGFGIASEGDQIRAVQTFGGPG